MPRDSSGNYTLPDGYLAINGEIIQPSQHNPPLEDIATALTGSLPRSGSAPMLGVLKLIDGSEGAPALTFNTASNLGLIKTTNGLGVVVGGELVAEFTAGGFVGTKTPGEIFIFAGATPPTGAVLCYGQAISRTTFDKCFAAIGTTYGAGDGSTTFNVPDARGRVLFGKDNMGGTAANRLTTGGGGINGPVLGAVGGAQTVTLTSAQMPSHSHTGFTGFAGDHTHGSGDGNPFQTSASGTGVHDYIGGNRVTNLTATTGSAGSHFHSLDINATGGGGAHPNVPPGIVFNVCIQVF